MRSSLNLHKSWQRMVTCLSAIHSSTCLKNFSRRAANYQRHTSRGMTKFSSKSLDLNDYDVIGFDLDGTLLRYNLSEMIPMEYEVLRRFLVEHRQYPSALLEKTFDWDFLQKGLLLDAERGNILKLDSEGCILRAAHGSRPLTEAEIFTTYGLERKWSLASQFCADPLSTWNANANEIRAFLDFFDMPVALLFAQIVDMLDAQAGSVPASKYSVWPDILDALVTAYSRDNFTNGKSAYFNELRQNPARFIYRTDSKVLEWLRSLRAAGKRTFLLTGSDVSFAKFTASFSMGADWLDYFDSVVCYAKKPGFFTGQRPFLLVENDQESETTVASTSDLLNLNATYSQGNWRQLHATLSHSLGKEPSAVRTLYLGDNLIQDVYTPVSHSNVDAVAISDELNIIDSDFSLLETITSKFWGPHFAVDGKPTFWTQIIANNAKICIPSITTIAEPGRSTPFVSGNPFGFYPNQPNHTETFTAPS